MHLTRKLKKDNKYVRYCLEAVFCLLDAAIAGIVGMNSVVQLIYVIANIVLIWFLIGRNKLERCMEFTFLFMLFYSYTLEVLLHYLGKKVNIDLRYLILIPLIISFLKIYNSRRINVIKKATVVMLALLVINTITCLLSNVVTFDFWIKNISLYFMFYIVYLCSYSNAGLPKELYIFVYCISIPMTLLQTFLGFHVDCRNALFGVFGLGEYAIFILILPLYVFSMWLYGKETTLKVAMALIITVIVLLCTENKMAIGILIGSCILIALITRKISWRTIIIPVLLIGAAPLIIRLIIKFYPKFYYISLSPDYLIGHFLGNSNRANFRYGRYESVALIFNDFDILRKIFGYGIGSATPLNRVFYNEMGIGFENTFFVKQFGLNHGFVLSGLGTMLFDGGYILVIPFAILFTICLVNTIRGIASKTRENYIIVNSTMLASLIFAIYVFLFGNMVISQNLMIVIAYILGFTSRVHHSKNRFIRG